MAPTGYPRPVRIVSLENLRKTWRNSRSLNRSRAAGIDGVTPGKFRERLESNLHSIRNEVICGRYQFSNLRPIAIPKQGGGNRLICVPTISDRLLQRLVADHLVSGDKLRIKNAVSYGFIEGRGVGDAVKRARNLRNEYPWAFKSDISSFFDCIGRHRLKDGLRTRLRRSSVVPFLLDVIDCEIELSDPEDQRIVEAAGIREGEGLRQGMPLSPLLSNFVLRRFDKHFETRGAKLVRYADDFILFSKDRAGCEAYFDEARSILLELGHKIPQPGNDSKTKICDPEQEVDFLGLSISPISNTTKYKILAPSISFDSIKKKMERFHNFDFVFSNYGNLSRAISRINSTTHGFLNAYTPARNFKDLRAHTINCRREACKQLFIGVFGSNVMQGLDDRRQSFLELDIA